MLIFLIVYMYIYIYIYVYIYIYIYILLLSPRDTRRSQSAAFFNRKREQGEEKVKSLHQLC